jgi:hypothetical protein
MPAQQRGSAYKLANGRWGLRYRDSDGERRHTPEKFPNKTAALRHYRDAIEPTLTGQPAPRPLTLAEFVDVYLDRHKVKVRPRTVKTLRDRLGYATADFGDVPLAELEHMADEIAGWQAKLPARSRYGIMQALRQTLAAAVRWRYMGSNPAAQAGSNPQPPPRPVRAFTFTELDASLPSWRPAIGRCPVLSPRPGCGPRSGFRSSAVTSTPGAGCSTCDARCRRARSSS